ncbi:DUF3857 domain-containing protein [Candidatus Bipolaricaulota bacterium]|nr:DUF3857 domain-containing protein [Candidatus Bipolaricaulota bacterium]
MKKPIMFGLVTMMVGYLCLTVVAQAPASDLLAAAQAAAQRYPNAKAVYLTNDETIVISPNGTVSDTIHRTVLVQAWDREAAERYGCQPSWTPSVQCVPPLQAVEFGYARVISPDGKVTNLGEDDLIGINFFDLSALNPNASGSSSESKAVAAARPIVIYFLDLPEPQAGEVIDWQLTVTGKYPRLPGAFAKVMYLLVDENPVVQSQYKVEAPRGMLLRWAVARTDLRPEIQTGSDTITYTFRAHDIVPDGQLGTSTVFAVSPVIYVSTIKSWDAVAAAYAKAFADAVQPTPLVARTAAGVTAHDSSDEAKIEHLCRFVQDRIAYFPAPHLNPFSALSTLISNQGDCKDQAALLIALLKAVGIAAYPVLLNADTGGDVDFCLPPTPGQFNHVIVAVPRSGGGWWFLDPSRGTGLQHLPAQDAGKHAMLIIGEPKHLWVEVVTPVSTS